MNIRTPLGALALLGGLALTACSAGPSLPNFVLGAPVAVPNPGLEPFSAYPDGHLSVVPGPNGTCQTYWAEWESHRSLGCDPMAVSLDPKTAVITKGSPGSFDNGGAWLYSVARITDTRLVGFYHAEDREFPGDPSSNFTSWKSGAWAESDDDGLTWSKGGQFLTNPEPKPEEPEWGSSGDFSVIRHDGRFYAFFAADDHIGLAVSDDPEGRPGTWFKYYDGEFSEPGLGGETSHLPGLYWWSGGNPSVHYNEALGHFVMVWNEWDGDLDLAVSDDLVHWSATTLLDRESGEKNWYPTIVGSDSEHGGADVRLFYGHWTNADDVASRVMQMRPLHLSR